MKIVVLVKQVPHAGGVRAQLDEADELAVDQAVRIARQRHGVEITAVTMGPAGAVDVLRTALLLGAHQGVHVLDDRLHGCDALATSRVLAAVVDRLGSDLVLCGSASADPATAAVPAMVAERLGVAALCFADKLTVGENRVEIRRDDGSGLEVYAAALPAVVSVTERCGRPRHRPFTATVDARHKVVRTWSLADLGIDDAEVGSRVAVTVVRAVTPQRDGMAHLVVERDARRAAVRLADFLADRELL